MKLTLLFLFLFSVQTSFAIQGEILVLEAPLFALPTKESKVIQYQRKGDLIFLHPEHDRETQNETNGSAFLRTIDDLGREAYIPRDMVRIVYKDTREIPYRPIRKDITDYRLEEPVPPLYPVVPKGRYKTYLSMGQGLASRPNYPYPTSIQYESIQKKWEVTGVYAKNVPVDLEDRFYFGGTLFLSGTSGRFELANNVSSRESWTQAGIGPYFSYSIYKMERWTFGVSGSIGFLVLNRNKIEMSDGEGNAETRSFNSMGILPQLTSTFEAKELIGSIDLIGGLSMEAPMSTAMTSKTDPFFKAWWSSGNDRVSPQTTAEFSLFIGLQTRTN